MLKTRAGDIFEGGSGGACRFLRRKRVEDLTGLPTSTLYELMDRGDFPRPFNITARRVAWLESDVIKWQERILAARQTVEAA